MNSPDPFRPRDEPRDPPPSGVIDQTTGKPIPPTPTASDVVRRDETRAYIRYAVASEISTATREYMFAAQTFLSAFYRLTAAYHVQSQTRSNHESDLPPDFPARLGVPIPPAARTEGFVPQTIYGRDYVQSGSPDYNAQQPIVLAVANRLEADLRAKFGSWPFNP